VLDRPAQEQELARRLVAEKYQPSYAGDLRRWREASLPVAIDLERLEPDPLRIGKAFGRRVAREYPKGMAQGNSQVEVTVTVAPGRRGRIDLLLETDDGGRPLLVIVEVKATDWDARAPPRIWPNLARHARQVWQYLHALLPRLDTGELAGVQAALVYPRRPSHPGRTVAIEQALERQGISVPFYQELDSVS
jgi:hypothetical protein